MQRRNYVLPVLFAAVVALIQACDNAPQQISISIQPESITLEQGASATFTATVVGPANTSVTWVATSGTIAVEGNTVTFTAPTDQTGEVTLTATTAADVTQRATATITVTPASAASQEILLEDEPTTVELPSGATILLPPPLAGDSLRLRVRESSEPLADVLHPLKWASEALTLTPLNEATWPEGALIEVAWPVAAPDSLSPASFNVQDAIAVIDFSGGTGTSPYGGGFHFARVDAASDLSKLTVLLPANDLLTGNVGGNVDIRVGTNLSGLRLTVRPGEEGVYRIHTDRIPETPTEDETLCPSAGVGGLLTRNLRGGRDTAIVMVHGWQTLGQLWKWRPGDTPRNMVHCHAWEHIMSAYQHQGGTWQQLRADADLFTFRYDSDHRIAESGGKLATALEQVHDAGYRRVVLLAHSMGGLVSVEARHQLEHPSYLAGIVTLGTPYMGGILECGFTATETVTLHSGATQSALFCSQTEPLTSAVISPILELFAPRDGTHDLTQLSSLVSNPYLERLWAGSNNRNFDNTYAIYGDSFQMQLRGTANMTAAITAAWPVYGDNDGAVPVSSALASKTRHRSTNAALSNSELELTRIAAVSRDHGQLLTGCTKCADGRNNNANAYDPYFDKVALGLQTILRAQEDAGPPGKFTLTAQPYCTLTKQPGIRLTWDASGGATTYEIYRNGEFVIGNLSNTTSFDHAASITPGATYSYFIRAINEAGTTDSNTQTVTAEVEGCQADPVEGADLIITDLTVAPASAEPGSVVTATFNITNQGDTPSAATVTRIRINTGATVVTTSDPLLAELNTPPVPATESLSYSQSVTLPSDLADGNHLLWVIADIFNQGEQSNYDNDRASTALWVGAPLVECTSGDPNSASNPCELTTVEQLQAVSTNLAGHYALGGSINATATTTWNIGSGFEPIGSQDQPFTGTLDGRGFEIVGLTIDREDTDPVGLFAVVGSAGLIRDITLVGGTISGLGPVGAVAGLSHGTLQEIRQSNSVHGQDRVGGLVGVNRGLISGAMNFGAVEGSNLVGGIVGHNLAGGAVDEAQNGGSIHGETYVGGVVGLSEGGPITGASNTAQVTGENTVGGILGLGEEGVELAAARNTGPVIGGDSTGGVAGLHNGSIAASSNSGSVTGNDYVGGVSGLGGAGPVSNSSNSGHVIGRDYIGGLTGLITTGQITTSFNAGTVNGETYVGGIVSISQGNIQASYNVGRVEGTSEVGGITSILSGEATIVHGFSAGAVVATENASAIVSIYTPPERLVGAHFDSNTTGRPESDAGNGWTTAQMYQQATYSGWDFQSVWSMQEGVDYPDLVSNPR